MVSLPPRSCALVLSRELMENIWMLRGIPERPSDPSSTTGEGHAGWILEGLDMRCIFGEFREGDLWGETHLGYRA